MGLSLPSYTDPTTGVAVAYFVVSGVKLDVLNNQLKVSVNGYVSQADYNSGLSPVPNYVQTEYDINGEEYITFLSAITASDLPIGTTMQQLVTELIEALYTNMQSLPFFTGATIG